MGATLALIIGLLIAAFGFLIMQDPTRHAGFDPVVLWLGIAQFRSKRSSEDQDLGQCVGRVSSPTLAFVQHRFCFRNILLNL